MFYLHVIEDNIMKDLSYYSGHVSQLQNIFPIYEFVFCRYQCGHHGIGQ